MNNFKSQYYFPTFTRVFLNFLDKYFQIFLSSSLVLGLSLLGKWRHRRMCFRKRFLYGIFIDWINNEWGNRHKIGTVFRTHWKPILFLSFPQVEQLHQGAGCWVSIDIWTTDQRQRASRWPCKAGSRLFIFGSLEAKNL